MRKQGRKQPTPVLLFGGKIRMQRNDPLNITVDARTAATDRVTWRRVGYYTTVSDALTGATREAEVQALEDAGGDVGRLAMALLKVAEELRRVRRKAVVV